MERRFGRGGHWPSMGAQAFSQAGRDAFDPAANPAWGGLNKTNIGFLQAGFGEDVKVGLIHNSSIVFFYYFNLSQATKP